MAFEKSETLFCRLTCQNCVKADHLTMHFILRESQVQLVRHSIVENN